MTEPDPVGEWQATHPGGLALNRSCPIATGSSEAGAPSSGAAPEPWSEPVTRIGRGGQPWLSIAAIHVRNATTWAMSSADRFGFGIRRRWTSSE